ncbi:hypothetical protein IEO21_04806 [Rhodonia placenta]|uniref:Uncharacterized protein n=1 Tax=Rhodonia placenta TaxID=104341 RepID=A0A8H7U284_9APHY|nr:hypothetical protein IEO21_04806 [Postia placenta]
MEMVPTLTITPTRTGVTTIPTRMALHTTAMGREVLPTLPPAARPTPRATPQSKRRH